MANFDIPDDLTNLHTNESLVQVHSIVIVYAIWSAAERLIKERKIYLAVCLLEKIVHSKYGFSLPDVELHTRIRLGSLYLEYTAIVEAAQSQLNIAWGLLDQQQSRENDAMKCFVLNLRCLAEERRLRAAQTEMVSLDAKKALEQQLNFALEFCTCNTLIDSRWYLYFTLWYCDFLSYAMESPHEHILSLLLNQIDRQRTRRRSTPCKSVNRQFALNDYPEVAHSLLELRLIRYYLTTGGIDSANVHFTRLEKSAPHQNSPQPLIELFLLIQISLCIHQLQIVKALQLLEKANPQNSNFPKLRAVCLRFIGAATNWTPNQLLLKNFINDVETAAQLFSEIEGGFAIALCKGDLNCASACINLAEQWKNILCTIRWMSSTLILKRLNCLLPLLKGVLCCALGQFSPAIHHFSLASSYSHSLRHQDQAFIQLHHAFALHQHEMRTAPSLNLKEDFSVSFVAKWLKMKCDKNLDAANENTKLLLNELQAENKLVGSIQVAIWTKLVQKDRLESILRLSDKCNYVEGEFQARQSVILHPSLSKASQKNGIPSRVASQLLPIHALLENYRTTVNSIITN